MTDADIPVPDDTPPPDTQANLNALLASADEFDDLDAAYAEVARKPYGFTWDKRRWVLPHIGELDFRIQAEIENANELTLDQVNDLFMRLFGPLQAAEWKATVQPGPFLQILFERWIKHSGRKPGESRASRRSSKSTGASSRPTSAATTAASASPKRSTAKRAPRKAASPRGSSST
jgi:hypothetical protein